MKAYVEIVQRREKETGCDVLTHQKWSGANYMDGIIGSIQAGSSGSKSMVSFLRQHIPSCDDFDSLRADVLSRFSSIRFV